MIFSRKILHLDQLNSQEIHELYLKNSTRLIDYFPNSVKQTVDRNSAKNYLQELIKQENSGQRSCLGLSVERKLIGLLYILNLDQKHKTCEFAYFVDESWTGMGMATFLANKAIGFCASKYDVKEIILRIDPENKSSLALARRCGFKENGRQKNAFTMWNGKKVDLILYSLKV